MHTVHVSNVITTGVAMCLAVFLGPLTGMAAQEPGTQPKAGVPVEKPRIEPSPQIVATGCLAKDADRFLLRDAAIEIKPWVAPGVKNGGPGAPKASPSRTVFALQNIRGLETHVSHRIQVTGVVAPATANLPPSPDTIAGKEYKGVPQPTVPGPSAVTRLAPPSLDNKDVRMIAASCSQH